MAVRAGLFTRVQRGVAVAVSLSLATFVFAPACQIVGRYESFAQGDGAAPHPCDVLSASKVDKGIPLVRSNETDGNCYWIDKYEVTVEQYSALVLAANTTPIAWDAKSFLQRCTWKNALSDPAGQTTSDACAESAMSMESDPFRMLKPIRCVDWCDAQAFCLWAGGELCGGWTDGQFVGPSDVHDQWGLACSGANGWSYVSGTTAVLEQCNVGLSEAGLCPSLLGQNNCAPTDATSFPECKSPCGAVNMIGNVAEWVLSCGNPDADGGPGTECQYRGGSFAENLNDATCFPGPRHTMSISTRDRGIGLRCCAALTVDERNHLK